MTRAHSAWVVLKFGGTSVSSLANWKNIAAVVKKRGATGAQVLVVHSAVTGITDKLEKDQILGRLPHNLRGKP